MSVKHQAHAYAESLRTTCIAAELQSNTPPGLQTAAKLLLAMHVLHQLPVLWTPKALLPRDTGPRSDGNHKKPAQQSQQIICSKHQYLGRRPPTTTTDAAKRVS
jgi:hypothetical protein